MINLSEIKDTAENEANTSIYEETFASIIPIQHQSPIIDTFTTLSAFNLTNLTNVNHYPSGARLKLHKIALYRRSCYRQLKNSTIRYHI